MYLDELVLVNNTKLAVVPKKSFLTTNLLELLVQLQTFCSNKKHWTYTRLKIEDLEMLFSLSFSGSHHFSIKLHFLNDFVI